MLKILWCEKEKEFPASNIKKLIEKLDNPMEVYKLCFLSNFFIESHYF